MQGTLFSKRSSGQYYTRGNPFLLQPFQNWASAIDLKHRHILEPFAGANHIITALQKHGLAKKFSSFDINPQSRDVKQHDSLQDFPRDYDVIITNPPWLAKNSAKRRGLPYPDCDFDDLYKYCLKKSLQNAPYVAAMIPASYLRSNLFINRLHSFIALHDREMFCDTDNPVALALFMTEAEVLNTGGAEIYHDNNYIGNLQNLQNHLPQIRQKIPIRFNDPEGQLGFIAFDNTREASIRFCKAEELRGYHVTHNARMITRIAVKHSKNLTEMISRLNEGIINFRKSTHDVFLTPFKGLRQDGYYRRRMDFALARRMIESYV